MRSFFPFTYLSIVWLLGFLPFLVVRVNRAQNRNSIPSEQSEVSNEDETFNVYFVPATPIRPPSLDTNSCRSLFIPTMNIVEDIKKLIHLSKNIKICMYRVTHIVFCSALVEAKSKGATIKIFTDQPATIRGRRGPHYDQNHDRELFKLQSRGIEVKALCQHNKMMHHKFAIFELESREIFLMHGSLNWSRGGIENNYESTVITNKSSLVEPFSDEFGKLWNDSSSRTFQPLDDSRSRSMPPL